MLNTVLEMIEGGAVHIGVATDHVIESFRNRLWPGYKTGDGIEPALLAQFHPLEEALAAMGVVVWPMIELEADDALASAVRLLPKMRVDKVCIWTPDKTWRSAFVATTLYRSTAEQRQSAMQKVCDRSSASIQP